MRDSLIENLATLVKFESVEAPAAGDNAPFGKEVRRALDAFLAMAKEAGLRTGENRGYYGWAETGDEGKPLIGIAAHIDVVPAEKSDERDPFTLSIIDGRAYGRGTADDKGPIAAALEVLKRLGEGAPLRHRVRLIVGCNEETGSKCLKRYAAEDEIPSVTLVPDGDFPVINSEKGILHLSASVPPDPAFRECVMSLAAGERVNVVPARAEAVLNPSPPTVKRLVSLAPGGDVFRLPRVAEMMTITGGRSEDLAMETAGAVKVTAAGVAAHGSTPEKGENALWKMLAFIAGGCGSDVAAALTEKFCRPDAAEAIGIYAEDHSSGALTMNIGLCRYDGAAITLGLDLRLPLSADADETERKIAAALPRGSVVTRERFTPNLYEAEDSPLVTTLLSVYSRVTGERSPRPIRTGGGTYARELPSALAFGPTFPGETTDIHGADENIGVRDLYRLADIYYAAIKELDALYDN